MSAGKKINEYLRRLKNGEQCLVELFYAVSGHVKFIAYKYLSDKSLTDEVVMNTFSRLLDNIRSYDEQQNGTAWICKIAQHEAYSLNARERRHAYVSLDELPEEAACTADRTSNLEFDMDLENALSKLDEKDRQIVELRVFEDMTFQQIADSLGMFVGTVHKCYKRAIKQIKEEIF